MLLHLRPRLFSLQFGIVSVVDVEIPSLGLRLLGNVDLTTRRQYSNKHYAVACRKRGHKAVDGIANLSSEARLGDRGVRLRQQ